MSRRMLELFSGTGRMAQAFRDKGWIAKTIDLEYPADLNIDCINLLKETIINLLHGEPEFIWMSPPCTAFSVASIGKHWTGGFRKYEPKTEEARHGLRLMEICQQVIEWFPKAAWCWENPRGMMRKMPLMIGKKRHTITFCQYGERRMKPTDIWTNIAHWKPKPMCKNGMDCHDPAPRGAKTGTQGLKGSYERSALPFELCEEIADMMTRK